jgi:hypothetical protein
MKAIAVMKAISTKMATMLILAPCGWPERNMHQGYEIRVSGLGFQVRETLPIYRGPACKDRPRGLRRMARGRWPNLGRLPWQVRSGGHLARLYVALTGKGM